MSSHDDQNDPSDQPQLPLTLFRLSEALRRFRAYLARTLALSVTDATALLLIADAPGLTAGVLADRLGLSTGTVTGTIDRLEDSGHVVRAPQVGDRRGITLHLTADGRRTVSDMWDAYREAIGDEDPESVLMQAIPRIADITSRLNEVARREHPAVWPPQATMLP